MNNWLDQLKKIGLAVKGDPLFLLRLVWKKTLLKLSGPMKGQRLGHIGTIVFEYDFDYAKHISLMWLGCYEPYVVKYMNRMLRPGDIFIDVGANIGYLSAVAAAAVGQTGKVFAFEPSQREFDRLKAMAELNPEFSICCIKKGCSNTEATVEMDVSSVFGWNTLEPDFMRRDVYQKKEVIETIRLDHFINAEISQPSKIKLIKIDTEGFEFFILRGLENLFREVKPIILCEITPRALTLMNLKLSDLADWMAHYGYRAVSIVDEKTAVNISGMKYPEDVILLPNHSLKSDLD